MTPTAASEEVSDTVGVRHRSGPIGAFRTYEARAKRRADRCSGARCRRRRTGEVRHLASRLTEPAARRGAGPGRDPRGRVRRVPDAPAGGRAGSRPLSSARCIHQWRLQRHGNRRVLVPSSSADAAARLPRCHAAVDCDGVARNDPVPASGSVAANRSELVRARLCEPAACDPRRLGSLDAERPATLLTRRPRCSDASRSSLRS